MKKAAKELQKHLMTATSYMIPFVVAGGILYSLSILLGGEGAVPETGWLAQVNQIGAAGLALFIPVLGGYIAFSIADKPGLAPGFIAAYLAREVGAGFIGGIIAGFIAGYAVKQLKKIKIPAAYRTLGTIFLYPLGGTIIAGGAIVFILGEPLAMFMNFMTEGLNGMSGAAKAPLGLLLGAMVGVDMGGPINKVAYTFAQTQVDTLPYLMGGVGAAGAVAPIGIGLATILFRKKFSSEESNSGKAAILMGCMGITEGAIPFAATDPLRVIPAYVVGSATACMCGFLFGCENPVPWGGLVGLPVITNRLGFCAAIAIGSVITAVIIGVTKKEVVEEKAVEESSDDLDITFEDL
nr:PTS fructose transporter subunit EIIC [uncultured Mediterraneibacter sp.]